MWMHDIFSEKKCINRHSVQVNLLFISQWSIVFYSVPFQLCISVLFDFLHLRFRYIAGVIKNIVKRCKCFPCTLLHRRHLFFFFYSYTSNMYALLFAVVPDRVNPWKNTASENRNKNEDWNNRNGEEFMEHRPDGVCARSLFKTADTRFTGAA